MLGLCHLHRTLHRIDRTISRALGAEIRQGTPTLKMFDVAICEMFSIVKLLVQSDDGLDVFGLKLFDDKAESLGQRFDVPRGSSSRGNCFSRCTVTWLDRRCKGKKVRGDELFRAAHVSFGVRKTFAGTTIGPHSSPRFRPFHRFHIL